MAKKDEALIISYHNLNINNRESSYCQCISTLSKLNQIRSNQIESNQIKSNHIKSNQIKSNQIKSNQIKSN